MYWLNLSCDFAALGILHLKHLAETLEAPTQLLMRCDPKQKNRLQKHVKQKCDAPMSCTKGATQATLDSNPKPVPGYCSGTGSGLQGEANAFLIILWEKKNWQLSSPSVLCACACVCVCYMRSCVYDKECESKRERALQTFSVFLWVLALFSSIIFIKSFMLQLEWEIKLLIFSVLCPVNLTHHSLSLRF